MIQTLNQIIIVIESTYIFGCIWYRCSDFLFREYVLPSEPEERYWVVKFGLRHTSTFDDFPEGEEFPELMSVTDRLVRCMYFMLTTLSTVGYGDLYPISIAEKVVGSLI